MKTRQIINQRRIIEDIEAGELVALAKTDVFADWKGTAVMLAPAMTANRKGTIAVKPTASSPAELSPIAAAASSIAGRGGVM